jgi:hypothetical protein
MLEEAGYNFDQRLGEGFQEADTSSLGELARLMSNSQVAGLDEADGTEMLNYGLLSDADSSVLNEIAPGLGKFGTFQGLTEVGSDVIGAASDVANVPSEILDSALGENNVFSDVAGIGSNVIGEIGKGLGDLGSSIFGGGKSRAKREASAKAKRNAAIDLQNKIQGTITDSGFENRARVVDNEQTDQRTQALLNILANMDKTNL